MPEKDFTHTLPKIDEWIEVGSERWRQLDDTPAFTRKIIRYGLEDGWIVLDNWGRVFCKFGDTPYIPLHFSVGTRTYGYKLSTKAPN